MPFKIFLISFIINFVFGWKPIIIGHRGSNMGVDNSVEAFRNGADVFHFQGLECDIMMTKDKKFVTSHDLHINGTKGEMIISKHTLKQLKSNLITQIKNNISYTGYISTLEEYLTIVKEKNITPIIEIKLSPGFDSEKLPMFPKLEKIIRQFGLSEKVIFISFYEKAIEYIKTNYPQYPVQYLIFNLYHSQLDWLKKWKVIPNMNCFYLTYERYNLFLKTGVKDIACWGANDPLTYEKLSKLGIYMMTTDDLYPEKLKEFPYKPNLTYAPFHLVVMDVINK